MKRVDGVNILSHVYDFGRSCDIAITSYDTQSNEEYALNSWDAKEGLKFNKTALLGGRVTPITFTISSKAAQNLVDSLYSQWIRPQNCLDKEDYYSLLERGYKDKDTLIKYILKGG